jgi:hypothetical protein
MAIVEFSVEKWPPRSLENANTYSESMFVEEDYTTNIEIIY